MDCGETIFVKDINGSYAKRVIAQCHDRFLLITHGLEPYNGYILSTWEQVLDELVAVTVPAKLLSKQMTAESHIGGGYVNIQLTYPLSVKGLADLFGVDPADVRAHLEDLAVQVTA
jgi:hypothetical protein